MKWCTETKGFGFIVPDDGGGDLFVERKAILSPGPVVEGQRVQFDTSGGGEGKVASNIQAMEGGSGLRREHAKQGSAPSPREERSRRAISPPGQPATPSTEGS